MKRFFNIMAIATVVSTAILSCSNSFAAVAKAPAAKPVLKSLTKIPMSKRRTEEVIGYLQNLTGLRVNEITKQLRANPFSVDEAQILMSYAGMAIKNIDQGRFDTASKQIAFAEQAAQSLKRNFKDEDKVVISNRCTNVGLIFDEAGARKGADEIKALIKKNDMRGARKLSRQYLSEIQCFRTRFKVGYAVERAQDALLGVNTRDFPEARLQLVQLLLSIDVIESDYFKPIIRAQAYIGEIERLSADKEANWEKIDLLMAAVDEQLVVAEIMGYAPKQETVPMKSLLSQVQDNLTHDKETHSVLSKLNETLEKYVR